jgi:hypothetical protein
LLCWTRKSEGNQIVKSVPSAQPPSRAKWQELCRRHSRRHRRGDGSWAGGAPGDAAGPMDLGRRLGRRHRKRGVDAWRLQAVRAQQLGRWLGRRHNSLPGLTAVRRSAGPTRTVPTATVPTALSDRRAGRCADGRVCADGGRGCAEAILCRRRCADGSRRHSPGPMAVYAVPTAAGRRPLGGFP